MSNYNLLILIFGTLTFLFFIAITIQRNIFQNKILRAISILAKRHPRYSAMPALAYMRYRLSKRKNSELADSISEIENTVENQDLLKKILAKRIEREVCISKGENLQTADIIKKEEALMLEQLAKKLSIQWESKDGFAYFDW